MNFNFADENVINSIFSAEFGLEKECLRVDAKGYLSHTSHPFGESKNIQRDFCENQTEFITEVFNSPGSVCRHLRELHKKAASTLSNNGELLWCFSNPPYVKGEDDIPVARFEGRLSNKSAYREYLANKYGKMKMLYSGIHLNFSFPDGLLKYTFASSGEGLYSHYKNKLYLQLAQKLLKYSWLIVYLTASSPVMDGSFFKENAVGKAVVTKYSSARCSEIGYWNDFTPVLDYNSIGEYVESIKHYINNKMLRSASELYYPIRLKPRGENSLENLLENGVNHIELRMLDVNPLSPIGIFEEDIKFIHCLIIYLMSLDSITLSDNDQITAISNEKASACLNDTDTAIDFNNTVGSLKDKALKAVLDIEEFFKTFNISELNQTIEYQKKKIINPSNRYANIVVEKYGKNYVKNGVLLSEKYAEELLTEA